MTSPIEACKTAPDRAGRLLGKNLTLSPRPLQRLWQGPGGPTDSPSILSMSEIPLSNSIGGEAGWASGECAAGSPFYRLHADL